jgi:uncharacterized protein
VIDRLRVVLDTNVFVSAFLSRNPSSPTQEVLQHWYLGEFVLLVSDALLDEIGEKLLASRISSDRVTEFLALLGRLAEWVAVPAEAIRPVVLSDPDDDAVIACAVVGKADYLITYDTDFEMLKGNYKGIKITKAVPFLLELRGELSKDI